MNIMKKVRDWNGEMANDVGVPLSPFEQHLLSTFLERAIEKAQSDGLDPVFGTITVPTITLTCAAKTMSHKEAVAEIEKRSSAARTKRGRTSKDKHP